MLDSVRRRVVRPVLASLLVAAGGGAAALPAAAQESAAQIDYSDLSTLAITRQDGIATIALNNPPINVLDVALMTDLGRLAGLLAADETVHVAVFESNVDGFFMARADLALLGRLKTLEGPSTEVSPFHGLTEAYGNLPQVTIAKIHGIARGAGSEFALALDMRFAAEDAVLGQPEIGFGLQPGGGGLVRLPQMVGRARALEIVLSGRDYTGIEAATYGWVNAALPVDALDVYVDELAARIAAHDPAALAHAKAAFLAVEESEGTQKLLTDFDRFVEAVQSEAAAGTIEAFLALGPANAARETRLHETLAGLNDE